MSVARKPKIKILSRLSLDVAMLTQPDETTCGPTSLHAVYDYFDDKIELEQVVREVHKFEDGGTLAVWLGCHALSRGYDATLYTCNLQLLDPTWFEVPGINLVKKLREQVRYKREKKLVRTSRAFIDFLELGGQVKLEDITRELLRKAFSQGYPVLTGLSSTFLYRSAREVPPDQHLDDVKGEPAGHFVVLCGYDRDTKLVTIADPLALNPYSATRKYEVHIDRVICSILLGVLTYDANFLIIKPKNKIPEKPGRGSDVQKSSIKTVEKISSRSLRSWKKSSHES
jgi:hypothetical protein